MSRVKNPRTFYPDSVLLIGAWAFAKPGTRGAQLLDDLVRSSLAQAFSQVGLDVENGEDWPIVTLCLAMTVFGPRGVGAPKKWKPGKRQELLSEYLRRLEANPKKNKLQICKEIAATGMFKVSGKNPAQALLKQLSFVGR